MNIPVLAELGRFPLKLSIDVQMIKYFIRFNSIAKDRYTYKIYKESLKSDNCTKSKWFFYIKRIVDEIGFSYIWISQLNERNCKQSIAKTFLQRLKDIYSQNALRYINKDENSDSGKMQFLRKIKDNYAFEPYLNIQNSHHRKSISQIRLSSHRLAIETGRWQNFLREK